MRYFKNKMAKITYRTILVIGDNHEEIVKKYSADTKVKKYVKMKFADAEKERKKHVKLLETILTDKRIPLSDSQYDIYKEMYLSFNAMDDFEYFREITDGCEYDEKTGDALTDENPNAFYKYERCQQHRLDVTGEEGDFSDPFPLKDGTKAYSAHFNDIDWEQIHRNPKKMALNARVWELVVNNDEPQNEQEENIKKRMYERIAYFENNFKTKEEFINHSSSLWYWGVATDKKYEEVNYKVSDMDWCVNFYDKYLRTLAKTNPLITIYEVHSLD